jgi:hypothetical protein
MVSMRDFRNNFQRIDEPVKVVRARGDIEVIGTWTPVKKKPNGHEEPQGES